MARQLTFRKYFGSLVTRPWTWALIHIRTAKDVRRSLRKKDFEINVFLNSKQFLGSKVIPYILVTKLVSSESFLGCPAYEKEGPEGLGRKNFTIWTRYNWKAGSRVPVLL